MTEEDRNLVEELLGSPHISNVAITDRAAARIEALSAEVEQARLAERAAIVAWLRSSIIGDEWLDAEMLDIASAIEAGDHLK